MKQTSFLNTQDLVYNNNELIIHNTVLVMIMVLTEILPVFPNSGAKELSLQRSTDSKDETKTSWTTSPAPRNKSNSMRLKIKKQFDGPPAQRVEAQAGYSIPICRCTDELAIGSWVGCPRNERERALASSAIEITNVYCASCRVWAVRDFIIEQGDDFNSHFHKSE